MARPDTLADDIAIRGSTYFPTFEFLDADGDAIDLSVGTVDVVLRLRHKAAGGSPTEFSLGAGDTQFPDSGTGTNGKIQFLLSAADTLALQLGKYDLEIVYEDTGTAPDTVSVRGRGVLVISDPTTGDL